MNLKSQLGNVAPVPALSIGWYHGRNGDVPQEELLGMVRAEALDGDGKPLLLQGIQSLVPALGEVRADRRSGESTQPLERRGGIARYCNEL